MASTTNRAQIVVYESKDRLALIDETAKALKCSRSELYRRAMRIYLVGQKKVRKTNIDLHSTEGVFDDHE